MQKNISIVLIKPPSLCVEDDRLEPPLGILYIAAVLREKGYGNVILYDMTGCGSEEEVNEKIRLIPEGNVYGIACLCTDYQYVKRIIQYIRKNDPGACIITGGPNPTAIPGFTLQDTDTSVVITGEGEDAFVQCVEEFEKNSLKKGIVNGIPRRDINTYPFPARDLADLYSYSRTLMGEPVVSVISSRGCKFRCIHCNSTVMGGGSLKPRFRSAENILEEIRLLRARYKYFRFNDDHFTGNPELHSLLGKLKDTGIQFRIFARVEDLDKVTCQLLNEAGCKHLTIGLESLNPDNLRILGKASQIGKEDNLAIARSFGLTIRVSLMVGLPFDTEDTIARFFTKVSRLAIDEFAVYPLIPYPGTQIWDNPSKFGYSITNRDFSTYVQMGISGNAAFALNHKNFSPEKVEQWKMLSEEILLGSGIKHMKESTIAK